MWGQVDHGARTREIRGKGGTSLDRASGGIRAERLKSNSGRAKAQTRKDAPSSSLAGLESFDVACSQALERLELVL